MENWVDSRRVVFVTFPMAVNCCDAAVRRGRKIPRSGFTLSTKKERISIIRFGPRCEKKVTT
jgi:hypothetical protein